MCGTVGAMPRDSTIRAPRPLSLRNASEARDRMVYGGDGANAVAVLVYVTRLPDWDPDTECAANHPPQPTRGIFVLALSFLFPCMVDINQGLS